MVSGVVTRPRWHLGSSQRSWLGGSIPWSSYTDRPGLKSSEAATWDAEEKSKLVTKAVVAHGATSVRHTVGPEARDMRATGQFNVLRPTKLHTPRLFDPSPLDEKSRELFGNVCWKLRSEVEYARRQEAEQRSKLQYMLERVRDIMTRLRTKLGRPHAP